MRWGICGAGYITHDFCNALQLLNHEDHQIAAIADPDIEKAQKYADEFKIPKAFGCHEDMAKEETVDIVYIGVVNVEHCRLSVMMLNGGKHVLCEKPVTINLKQLEKILKTAKEQKRFFMEALWSRFLPTYEKVKEALDSKSVGEVRYVQAEFFSQVIHRKQVANHELGGGGLLYIGTYPLQLALLAFKEPPDEIIAVGHVNKDGIDENATIIFKYKGGAMANLTYNAMINSPCTASICGTEGIIQETFVPNTIKGIRYIGTHAESDPDVTHRLLVFPWNMTSTGGVKLKTADDSGGKHLVNAPFIVSILAHIAESYPVDNDELPCMSATPPLGPLCRRVMPSNGQLHTPFWVPTKVTINGKEMEFPLPSGNPDAKYNFINSAGLSYEAECVRKCIQEGLLECPVFPHSESIKMIKIMDEIRKQLGVKFDADALES